MVHSNDNTAYKYTKKIIMCNINGLKFVLQARDLKSFYYMQVDKNIYI